MTTDEIRDRAEVSARARFDRGQFLTNREKDALQIFTMYSTPASCPVRKTQRGWGYDAYGVTAPTVYKTKREAVASRDLQVAILDRLDGLQTQAEYLAAAA